MKAAEGTKGWRNILVLVFLFVFISPLFESIGSSVSQMDLFGSVITNGSEDRFVMGFFRLFGVLLIVFILAKYIEKTSFLEVGFHTKNRNRDVMSGILVGAVVLGLGYIVLILLNEISFNQIHLDGKELFLTFLIFVSVAFTEELLLRGCILRNLMYSMNQYLALMVSALVFSLLHLGSPHINSIGVINLFLAGILLGLPYIYTRSLWFSIALHFSWNFFQSFFGFNVSGQSAYSFIEFEFIQGNSLNGGNFGFEGSLHSIYSQLVLILLVFLYYRHTCKGKDRIDGTFKKLSQ